MAELNFINNIVENEKIVKIIFKNTDKNTDVQISEDDKNTILSQGVFAQTIEKETIGNNPFDICITSIINSIQNINNVKSIALRFEINPNFELATIMEGMDILYEALDEETDICFATLTNPSYNMNHVKIFALTISDNIN